MAKSIRILLLEDQEADAILAKREIKKIISDFEIEWVDNRDDFIKAIKTFDPEIIISDFRLPTFDGLSAMKIQQELNPEVPFIMFTGSINEDTAVSCMKAGAADYIIKEHLKRLGPAVVSALEQKAIRDAKQRAEVGLRLSEERFHRLAENMPDMIYRISMIPDRSFEYINKACESITGYTVEEFYNDSTLGKRAIHPDDLKVLDKKIISGQYFYNPILTRLIRKDNKVIWIEQRNIPIFDEKGSLVAIEGIAQDVTEERNAEILKQTIYNIAQATNSTKNLDELYEEMHKSIATIMPVNNFYIALYHKETNEISFPYFIDEKDPQPSKREFKHGLTELVITLGQSVLCDYECSKNYMKEGKIDLVGELSKIWLGTPLTFEGNTIGVMVVQHYTDSTVYGEKEKNMLEYVSNQVTKAIVYKKAMQEIQKNSEQLMVQYNVLQDLIKELNQNNIELTIAKERAEESDKLKTAFLQNMSHEIRTPMNAIMGFSDLMEMELDNPQKLQYYTKVIKQRSNDLLDIINELLDIARIESGQVNLRNEPVDLNSLFDQLQSVYEEHKVQINKPHLKLIKKEVPKYINSIIQSDSGKLKQIIVNLIHNAFKFTNEGLIEYGFHSVTNDNIVFFVSDTGIGIPENMKSIIFERFRKSADESVYVQDGIGLGLAIVKGLIQIFGGKIWVESESGAGSTFYFSIPYTPAKQKVEPEKTFDIINFNWSKHTILIVEDDSYNSSLFIELLKSTKVNFLLANNGENAISIFNANPEISLVLMDVKLPDISGFALTTEFKKIHPQTPIIAQTAYAAESDKRKAYEVGCIDFISKPIKRDHLLTTLNKYLRE